MANTYTQIYIQFVFAVQNRVSLIHTTWKDELYKYITGIAFSYSYSHIDRVAKYIINQEQHHKKKTFREEYLELLNRFNIDYDERYILRDIQ